MTSDEARFVAIVDDCTRDLPDYDRGVTNVLALAAFKTGYRCGLQDRGR